MLPEELRERLLELGDAGYRDFTLKTCPQAKHLIGVRIPEQRKLAREIVREGDFWQFLDAVQLYYHEEILITGIVIATAPMGVMERFDQVAWFLPLMHDWILCDCFCASFKIKDNDKEKWWDFVLQWRDSQDEFALRFLFVMILDHLISEEYLPQIFELLDTIKSDKYYVEMAKAWLVAEIFTEFREEVFEYLQRDQLSHFAHNKAIQKICESRRVSDEDKQKLRGMKF